MRDLSRLRAPNAGTAARAALIGLAALAAILATPAAAYAQALTIGLGEDLGLTERAIQLVALVTILSLAPSILIMVTSFTRIVVVLSILRTALGTQTAPPNTVIMALALFLTGFVMAPTMQAVYDESVQPLVEGSIEMEQAIERGVRPVHAFMREHVREKDLELFMDMAKEEPPVLAEDISLRTLVPAFMISELRRAFEIGFLLFVPFLIIDLVVASVLMSMGMMMLPPVIISLPFKLIFFVLVDGWGLVAGSLVQSFG
ncbi:MAG: flagellar type III secretion system pore protein FliP [Pseudomonadota bacterium]